jgi:hypothetical protein
MMEAGTTVRSLPFILDLIVYIITTITLAGVALSGAFAATAGIAADTASSLTGIAGAFAVADSTAFPFTLLFRVFTLIISGTALT